MIGITTISPSPLLGRSPASTVGPSSAAGRFRTSTDPFRTLLVVLWLLNALLNFGTCLAVVSLFPLRLRLRTRSARTLFNAL